MPLRMHRFYSLAPEGGEGKGEGADHLRRTVSIVRIESDRKISMQLLRSDGSVVEVDSGRVDLGKVSWLCNVADTQPRFATVGGKAFAWLSTEYSKFGVCRGAGCGVGFQDHGGLSLLHQKLPTPKPYNRRCRRPTAIVRFARPIGLSISNPEAPGVF